MQYSKSILVGARDSPLSKAQVEEVLAELQLYYPDVTFNPKYLKTTGDFDRTTSLRFLEKNDFFTKEVDELLLSSQCQIAIHSAKDLPEPLPKGLICVALTKGVDSSDSLVMQEDMSFETLPKGARIGTSSLRREEIVRTMKKECIFVDIRGTIHERLALLFEGKLEGVVIAEAALIRLKLHHLNRIKLPGETAPFQGRLAVLAREGDFEMKSLFECLHAE